MGAVAFRSEERIGLGMALLAHAGLVALLLWRPPQGDVVMPPDRIEVTLSSDVGLTSTSPNPNADAAPDVAPELGEPAPPQPEAAPPEEQAEPAKPEPQPLPAAKPAPRPEPKAEPKPQPKPVPKPVPRPVAKPSPQPPVAKPSPKPVAKPAPKPAETKANPKPAAKPAQSKPNAKPGTAPATKGGSAAAAKPPAKAGGSRIGNDFLAGVPGARGTTKTSNAPAAAIGPAVRSSLAGAISRQLKPHWTTPQGVDAEKLVTILAWDLNKDGTLAGTPRVVRQEGITDANRAQAPRHAEQAVRAVQLSAPFELPAEYYDGWKRVASFRFDKRLSQ